MEKLISVIIPVYNVGKYLRKCLDSVLAQAQESVEIIIVNDGSTDESPMIIREYRDKYPEIIVIDKENGGISEARNVGMSRAKGRYIMFLDSDDWWEENKIASVLEFIQKEEADIVLTKFKAVDDSGQESVFCELKEDVFRDKPVHEVVKYLLENPMPLWSVWKYVYRREFLEQHKLLFQVGMICGEDMNFVIRTFLLAGEIRYLDTCLYCYRNDRPESVMNRFSEKKIESLFVSISDVRRLVESNVQYQQFGQAIYNRLALDFLDQLWESRLLKGKQSEKMQKILAEHMWLIERTDIEETKKMRKMNQFIGARATVFVYCNRYKLKSMLRR